MKLFVDMDDWFYCCPHCGNVDWDRIDCYGHRMVERRETVRASYEIDESGSSYVEDVLEIVDDEWYDESPTEIDEFVCGACDGEFRQGRWEITEPDYNLEVFLDRFETNPASEEAYREACEGEMAGVGSWAGRANRNDREVLSWLGPHEDYNDGHVASKSSGDYNADTQSGKATLRDIILVRNTITLVEKLGEIGYVSPSEDRETRMVEPWIVRRWNVSHDINIEGEERTEEYNDRVNHPQNGAFRWSSVILFNEVTGRTVYLYASDVEEGDERVLSFEANRRKESYKADDSTLTYFPTTLDDLDRILQYVMEVPLETEEEEEYELV